MSEDAIDSARRPVPAEQASRRRAVRSARQGAFIQAIKIAMPLATALLVAAVIAWPRFFRYESGFTLAFHELTDFEDKLRMVKPRIMGTDSHDRPFVITAARATQPSVDVDEITLEEIEADVTFPNQRWLALGAASGVYRPREMTLSLAGRVTVFSDLGYEIKAGAAEVDLNASQAWSDQPVEGQGPAGVFRANAFRFDLAENTLQFHSGVRMRLIPGVGVTAGDKAK